MLTGVLYELITPTLHNRDWLGGADTALTWALGGPNFYIELVFYREVWHRWCSRRCSTGSPTCTPGAAAPDGQWWALLSWSLYGQLPGHNGHINCSGWVPASTVHQSTNPEEQRKYPDVPRLALPADLHTWPALPPRHGTRWHHYRRLTHRPGLPPGISVLTRDYPPSSGPPLGRG
jgi:hypothetical protein